MTGQADRQAQRGIIEDEADEDLPLNGRRTSGNDDESSEGSNDERSKRAP